MQRVYEEEDKKKREEIELRNTADSAVFTAERTLKEMGDKIDPADKQKIEDAVEKLKKALDGDDLEAIKREMDELTEAVYAVTTKMYQQAQAQSQTQAEQAGQKDENVVDAEYEVKE